jgi:hypothetical protein
MRGFSPEDDGDEGSERGEDEAAAMVPRGFPRLPREFLIDRDSRRDCAPKLARSRTKSEMAEGLDT